MTPEEARARFLQSDHAILATADAAGVPHLVPVVFAPIGDDTLVFAVDHKPKRTTALKRLQNISENPHVALLVEHYDSDWTRLWWVRADGTAQTGPVTPQILNALQEKHRPYREQQLEGPAVTISVHRWSGWAFTAPVSD